MKRGFESKLTLNLGGLPVKTSQLRSVLRGGLGRCQREGEAGRLLGRTEGGSGERHDGQRLEPKGVQMKTLKGGWEVV